MEKIHWTQLRLFYEHEGRDGENIVPADDPEAIEALKEFKRTGGMFKWFFTYMGLPNENPEDPSTWGPPSPDAVDWTGFPE